MSFDFELILVALTGLTAVIWLIDSLLFARPRAATADTGGEREQTNEPLLVEYSKSFFPVLLVVVVLRSFMFEPFRIPSGSMLPTLLIGDFILVNKFSYGVRLPVLHNKVLDTGEPERGDVAVFRYPLNPDQDYIKRIVGLPGDTIQYVNKQLVVNGEPVALESQGPYLPPGESEPNYLLLRLNEKFDNVDHDILINDRAARSIQLTVPDGEYFVMGDNRDNSNDSRAWGFVPEGNLVGKAVLIWMNLDFHWDRLGSSID
ncbi:MAG: signal peptidase I [Pseudomonadota bacterium]